MNLESRIKKLEQTAQTASTDDRNNRLRRMCAEKANELKARIKAEEVER